MGYRKLLLPQMAKAVEELRGALFVIGDQKNVYGVQGVRIIGESTRTTYDLSLDLRQLQVCRCAHIPNSRGGAKDGRLERSR